MSYKVIRKSDSVEVYRYNSTEPIEWVGMEFATHDHIEIPVDPPAESQINPEEWKIYVGPFFDRFGAYKIPILASTDPIVQAIIKDCSVRKYIDLYNRKAEISGAIDILIAKGFPINKNSILNTIVPEVDRYNG